MADKPPAREVCPTCKQAVNLTRDGRGRRVLPFHRADGTRCPGTGSLAVNQGD